MDKLLKAIETKHGMDYGFLLIGVVGLVLAISSTTIFLYVIAFLFILFGVLIFNGTYKISKSHKFIQANYQSRPQECLDIIKMQTASIYGAIGTNQRKADAGGKDSADSARDVVRLTIKLEKYLAVKTEIEKYL